MRVAVVGCAHGELEKIYEALEHVERTQNIKVDLLLCCGDFQSVRNSADLSCMACPPRYRQMCDFYKYYSGEKIAPVCTIFVGGNHEASNYLVELSLGGWVAPNIWYMGYAGVVRFGGLRIAGLSGIYKRGDYSKGHHELPPFSPDQIKSVYHIREFDVYRLLQLAQKSPQSSSSSSSSSPPSSPTKENIDIFLSHDWPQGIHADGDERQLLQQKKFLRDDIQQGQLGSLPGAHLLSTLQPSYWFSAHLHVKFAGIKKHSDGRQTRFLALDKCLPHRDFLQILEITPSTPGPLVLSYDREWLGILKATQQHFSADYRQQIPRSTRLLSDKELEDLCKKFESAGITNLAVPTESFVAAVPAHQGGPIDHHPTVPRFVQNPQTTELLKLLDCPDVLTAKANDNRRDVGTGMGMGKSSDSGIDKSSWGVPGDLLNSNSGSSSSSSSSGYNQDLNNNNNSSSSSSSESSKKSSEPAGVNPDEIDIGDGF